MLLSLHHLTVSAGVGRDDAVRKDEPDAAPTRNSRLLEPPEEEEETQKSVSLLGDDLTAKESPKKDENQNEENKVDKNEDTIIDPSGEALSRSK